ILKAPSCTTPEGLQLKDLTGLSDAYLEAFHAYHNGEKTQEYLNDVEEDVESCREVLENANKAAWRSAGVTVFERNKKRLLEHAKHWFAVANEIPNDTEFTRYLQDAINDLEDSWTETNTDPHSTG
ncbi:MAG: hypothetical protein OXB90_09230, partial [Acidimicrobiaceae bacterium]|nr:hypothetical protein [Acidimicrobiaceae bacterium]